MATTEKPKGPASYFPSIEQKYGRPIAHWLELARGMGGTAHMAAVERLKTENGTRHGHANAVVAFVRAEPGEAGR